MLDINDEQDAATLIQTISGIQREDLALVKKFLPNDPMWHQVGDFENVILTSHKVKIGVRFIELVEIARMLSSLDASYKNLDFITKKLKNITQVKATFFEIRVAFACHSDRNNVSMEFLDDRGSSGDPKVPEFCWRTNSGESYVECKIVDLLQATSKVRKKLENIQSLQMVEYAKLKWPPGIVLSVGVTLPLGGSYSKRLSEAVHYARNNLHKSIVVGEFSVLASNSIIEPEKGSIILGRATVKQAGTAERLVDATHVLTYMPYSSNLKRMLKKSLGEARMQVPSGCDGVIFVQVPASSDAVKNLVIDSLSRNEFANIQKIVVVDGGGGQHEFHNTMKKIG